MEQETNNHNKTRAGWCCGCNTKRGALGWGIFFLILGGYFLAQELGYVSTSVSAWPVVLTAFGIYLIVKNLGK
ncbi:MAG: DUF5668 domain-containing protein [Patescibacteria group bacterium]|nr:DUF5668 domain-containing protein [Patescibacteria group bacterium]